MSTSSPQSVAAFPMRESKVKLPLREGRSLTSVPDLIMARSLGWNYRARNTSRLSSRIAWNRSRMRNMILAVGPGTPAAVCWTSREDEHEDDDHVFSEEEMSSNQETEETAESDEEEMKTGTSDEEGESKAESDDAVDHDDNEGEDHHLELMRQRRRDMVRRATREQNLYRVLRSRIMDGTNDRPDVRQRRMEWSPSLRHGGCINTACWLDTPWRVSSLSVPVDSIESPTQLITSGDDRLIKIWDVTASMGMASPLPGGWDTFAPLANNVKIDTETAYTEWKRRYAHSTHAVPGSVQLLATLVSGHRGNVFHVTPSEPGRVLSCAADGFLRLSDMVSEVSSVVVNPHDDTEDSSSFGRGMAFSHQMLTRNTGLLCSERGLHHFDLRLSPREQSSGSLLRNEDEESAHTFCKACAVWPPQNSKNFDTEPTMIFVGGSTPVVELLDLRMDGSRRNVLQRYRPRWVRENGRLSVSGLDVSKNGRELLVSYESDQIYSFPIFPECSTRPNLDEIDAMSTRFVPPEEFLPEMACYGGHLNRFTFLKNAKYAGPNDEYVTTGSDSGNAWIYERKTGTVVSLLSADTSTCNGIIPHPSLPVFVTYGIDSTAKLWRAAPCVDPKADDSRAGRAKAALDDAYEMSPVTKSWDGVQSQLRRITEDPGIMPDFVASSEEMASSGRFSSPSIRRICGSDSSRLGNAYKNLPSILRQNRFECYRSHHDSRTVPVSLPLDRFTLFVTLIRTRLQADRVGAKWDAAVPWALQAPSDVHKADLVPDNPSDWILFDVKMRDDPMAAIGNWNPEDYKDLFWRLFPDSPDLSELKHADTVPFLLEEQQKLIGKEKVLLSSGDRVSDNCGDELLFKVKSRWLLYETALLLKEGGNEAVKEGLFNAAARRYDKAIQYCAVAFMQYYEGTTYLSHLTSGHHGDNERRISPITKWSPLLRVLITARLNLSLLMLKPEFALLNRAAEQARAAIKLLFPFTREEGKVVIRRGGEGTKDHVVIDQEPVETYREAVALQAKAYFRQGSAELEMGDYGSAVKFFELSLKSSAATSPNMRPDSLLSRRLEQAKRKRKAKKKRERKKYQKLLQANAPSGGSSS